MYAGEAIALVVAETAAQAQDAAQLIAVDYSFRRSRDLRTPRSPDVPQLYAKCNIS